MFKTLIQKEETLEEAWGNLIKDLSDWDWFATFTFAYATSYDSAGRLWRQEWLFDLECTVAGQVNFVRVFEDDKNNPHFHVLLSGVKDEDPREWENMWKYGIAEIKPYDPELPGAYYLGNKIALGMEVSFSKNIERKGKVTN